MTYKIERIISTICFVAAIVLAAIYPAQASCETLRFVYLADSRGDALDHPVNTEVLTDIIRKIGNLQPRPAFVIFGGDMSYRGYIHTNDIDTGYTFKMWKDLFKDLTNAGIPLYTAIGNHELYRHDDSIPSNTGFFLENQEEYKKVFSENPHNGPQGYTPSYDGLVYSFTSPGGDAFFAFLDPYYLTQDIVPDGLGGHIDQAQLEWLAHQVAKTKATHKFLFIHTPYYYVTGQDSEELSKSDDSFTKLWTILDDNRFDFYACGHSHLYSRKTIDRRVLPIPQTIPPIRPPWRHDVVQLLNGTSGAIVDSSAPAVNPKLWHVHQQAETYYFSVVDIDGNKAKVASYGINTLAQGDAEPLPDKVVDKFTINRRHRERFSHGDHSIAPAACLFDWAEKNYPGLFAPSGATMTTWGDYTFRYYSSTNAYLGVSSLDRHVYYIGVGGVWEDEGRLVDWLPKAGCQIPAQHPNGCLFNWAERNYPSLFAPPSPPSSDWYGYNYRYYSATNSYLGVSSNDNHVYYMGHDRQIQDEGPTSYWLPLAGCR